MSLLPEYAERVEEMPYLFLTCDLPATPLFRDEKSENIIPQVQGCACVGIPLLLYGVLFFIDPFVHLDSKVQRNSGERIQDVQGFHVEAFRVDAVAFLPSSQYQSKVPLYLVTYKTTTFSISAFQQ